MGTIISGIPDLEELIRHSLLRSAAYGVDPHASGAPESSRLSNSEFEKRIQRQDEYFKLARAQLDNLYRLLKGTGFCMALADGEGYILYVVGDADLIEHFKNRRCLPGYRWTERDLGTCVIGLTLEERVPIFLPGNRMFASKAQGLSNAGAPVFSPDGSDVIGVVSISGYTDNMHVHTLGLVRQAAETITAQLRERERSREIDIHNKYMDALLESSSKGLLTVDRMGVIVHANRRARIIMELPGDVIGKNFSDFVENSFDILDSLAEGRPFSSREFQTKEQVVRHFASLDLIRDSEHMLVGALLTVTEKKEILKVVTDMAGSQAHFTFDSIIGTSENIREALRLARISSSSDTSVLLTGETGTGKELFAQAIHNESSRRTFPFVAINCGAIPKELLESELFGYEEGAFTGAKKGGRPGKFELADNGTLFLDEIGDMPFDMQVKLLRVLQTGEIQRVGGLRSVPVNLRVISATNKDLRLAIREQQFREDLYYRICTLNIEIPSLRERGDDILLLAGYFLRRQSIKMNREYLTMAKEAEAAIKSYSWPGNIRQLESRIERAIHLAEGEEVVTIRHFGMKDLTGRGDECQSCADTVLPGSAGVPTLAEVEKQAIIQALNYYDGNICHTATSLGISRPTVYRKMKNYGIT